MDSTEIKAIDTMCRIFYCNHQLLRQFFECYETRVAASTTLAGVMKKLGLASGEEWKILASMGKASPAEMLAEMDEAGVEYVFIDQLIMWGWREHQLVKLASPEMIGQLIQESKGKVVGGGSYNPFRIRESLDELERGVKVFGFKYVWFHPISFGLQPNDKKCYPLYATCSKLGIPVSMQVGHSAEPLPSWVGHPMNADEVALDFPELTIILTHTGWPWIDEWMSMVWRHTNVYGNIGAYYPSALDPALIRFMDSMRGQSKVLWATNGFGLTRCKKEFLGLPIKDETKRKVLRENALRVFKLEQ